MTADTERLELIKGVLREKAWDALVAFHPDSILMTAGMFPGSTHVASVVTVDGKVVLITPWWRESFVREESWVNEILCFDWCKPLCEIDPLQALFGLLKKSARNLALERIGFEGQVHHYNPAKLPSELFTYQETKERLPEIFRQCEDATPVIDELKAVKSSREIEKLRLTHEVAWAGVQAFYLNAVPGIRECDLAAEVNYAVLKMVGHKGIRYTYCDPPQITSGSERTVIGDTMSNHSTQRCLQDGDPVMLELGLHADGYWADITRCLVVSRFLEIQEKLHEAVVEAQRAAVAAYVPFESTGEQLCEAAWAVMRNAGFAAGITHGLGHGVGFAYHENQPNLGPGCKTPIRPGQVTSIEPGLYWRTDGIPVAGIRVEDNVVWGREKGQVELLSDFYRGLGECFGGKSR
jgi:Xaa-Pro aminopeptidase